MELGFVGDRRTSTVTVAPFTLSRTPISVGQYKECVAVGECSAPALDISSCRVASVPVVTGKTYDTSPSAAGFPVTCVTPRQATEYCAWVGGKLPTLEQWVYAARGPSVKPFAWGTAMPDCTKNQRVSHGPTPGADCCSGSACDPSTFSVGQRPDVASPSGLLDVLLTPAELIAGHTGSPIPACGAENGACVVRGRMPGAIEFAVHVSDQTTQPAYDDPGVVAGFRCSFEVKR